jgi:group I intron endonuclease
MYIGSHKGTTDDGYIGSGKYFNHAVQKYGIENFQREILEEVIDNLHSREQYYIDEVDAANNNLYYNIASQAGGGWDLINTPENCKKAGERLSKWRNNNPHPQGMKGKKQTAESNAIRSVKTKRWMQENKEVFVYQFTFAGKLKKKHDSITDAARSVGGSPSNIKYTCDGKFNSAYGYLWSYTNAIDVSVPNNCKKKVQTPDGIFESVGDVVKHYNFSSTTQVRRRCFQEKYKEWKYINEE